LIVGHYAAALLPYSRLRRSGAPFWLLLLCANIPEFLWLALALAGVEAPTPPSMLDATFQNLKVDMIFSHNLVPGLIQAAVTGLAVLAVYRRRDLALWGAFLVIFHVLCDYVVGFEHQVLGKDSPVVSLDSYARFPHLAIFIELAFSVGCVFLYHRSEARQGRVIPARRQLLLYAVFILGVSVWLPTATLPLRAVLP
jgi:hypothetical protein